MAQVPEPDDFLSGNAAPDDFVSGNAGMVTGIRATSRALVADALADTVAVASGLRRRLRRAASSAPPRRVLALGIERPDQPNLLDRARRELLSSHHQVRFAGAVAADRGKFENLNALLADNPPPDCDWLVVVDDDVALPHGFLDEFIFLTERFSLRLAQPAHRSRSHAAWDVTRRRPGSVVRETAFVEIGPVLALHRVTFDLLLPFPELRAGWGLDLHWSAVAREQGWKQGVVDATPITHGTREIASTYDRSDALAEARQFLSGRPYTSAREAQRTLVTHRTWT